MKFYIATGLGRAAAHNAVRDALVARGHVLTYDWTVHGSVQAEGEARIAEVARREVQGVLDADCVVVLLPGGRGTHVELGVALAFPSTRVIVHAERAADFLDERGRTCAFYHAPGVERVVCAVGALVDHLLGRP